MDQEVAKTLGELERKLQELERELTSIGRRDAPSLPADRRTANAPPIVEDTLEGHTPGMLVDEAVERVDDAVERREREPTGRHDHEPTVSGEHASSVTEARAREIAVDSAFGGPAVWGGEEVPAQAGATVEREWTTEVRETAYGEIPTPPSTQWPSRDPPLPPPLPQPHLSQPPLSQPHHPYASIPPEREAIELDELVRFREKMRRTLDELIDEYSRLLAMRPPS